MQYLHDRDLTRAMQMQYLDGPAETTVEPEGDPDLTVLQRNGEADEQEEEPSLLLIPLGIDILRFHKLSAT